MCSPADEEQSLKLVCWWSLDNSYDKINKTNLYLWGVVSNQTNEAASLCIAIFYRYCTTNMGSMLSGSQISTSVLDHVCHISINMWLILEFIFLISSVCFFVHLFIHCFQPQYFYLTPPHTPLWLLTMGISNTDYLTDWTAYFFSINWMTFDVNIVLKSFQAYIYTVFNYIAPGLNCSWYGPTSCTSIHIGISVKFPWIFNDWYLCGTAWPYSSLHETFSLSHLPSSDSSLRLFIKWGRILFVLWLRFGTPPTFALILCVLTFTFNKHFFEYFLCQEAALYVTLQAQGQRIHQQFHCGKPCKCGWKFSTN